MIEMFDVNARSKMCISKDNKTLIKLVKFTNFYIEQNMETVRTFVDFNNIRTITNSSTLSLDLKVNGLDDTERQFIEYVNYCHDLHLDLEILTESGDYIKTPIINIGIGVERDYIGYNELILHFKILISDRFEFLCGPKSEAKRLLQEEKKILSKEEYLACLRNEVVEILKANNNKIGSFEVSREELLKSLCMEV